MSSGSDILTFLAVNGLGTLDIDLFLNDMPETPNTCGAIYETAGASPELGFGTPGIKYEHPGLQIRFRGEPNDDEAPRLKARSAFLLLPTIQGQTLSGTLYLLVKPSQQPFLLERDGNARTVWAFNALADKEP